MYYIHKDSMKPWSSVKKYAVNDSSCAWCIWQVPICEQNLSKLLLDEVYFIWVWLINSLRWGGKGVFFDSTSNCISPCNISQDLARVCRGLDLSFSDHHDFQSKIFNQGSLCWLESTHLCFRVPSCDSSHFSCLHKLFLLDNKSKKWLSYTCSPSRGPSRDKQGSTNYIVHILFGISIWPVLSGRNGSL